MGVFPLLVQVVVFSASASADHGGLGSSGYGGCGAAVEPVEVVQRCSGGWRFGWSLRVQELLQTGSCRMQRLGCSVCGRWWEHRLLSVVVVGGEWWSSFPRSTGCVPGRGRSALFIPSASCAAGVSSGSPTDAALEFRCRVRPVCCSRFAVSVLVSSLLWYG